jgi:hypothetical protein
MIEFLIPLLEGVLTSHGVASNDSMVQSVVGVAQLAVDHSTSQKVIIQAKAEEGAAKDTQIRALTDQLATAHRMIDLQTRVREMFPEAAALLAKKGTPAPVPQPPSESKQGPGPGAIAIARKEED